MVSELSIRTAIVRAFKERGCWVLVTTGVSTVGCPDLLVCRRDGEFLALEVKTPEGRATKIQLKVLNDIGRAGGHTAIVRSVDDALAMLGSPSK